MPLNVVENDIKIIFKNTGAQSVLRKKWHAYCTQVTLIRELLAAEKCQTGI